MSAPALNPVADLSYRNYDGPLEPPNHRWWSIAKMTMRLAFKKKSMWVAMAFSTWYYVAMVFVLFVLDQFPAPLGQASALDQYLGRMVWKDQFLHGFSYGQTLFLIMALILGAGAIANDTRANALLVYLSKPCTKKDYVMGKWVGIFLPLLMVMAIPSLFFFAYGAMSYRTHGFFSQDPWLLPKLLLLMPLAAGFHASLILGISSLFDQGRVAGAAYAGLYFLSNFFTLMMAGIWGFAHGRHPNDVPALVTDLFYGSIDGVNIGLAKAILGTDGSIPFNVPTRTVQHPVPAPSLLGILVVISIVGAVSLFVAWIRVKPVEVVK